MKKMKTFFFLFLSSFSLHTYAYENDFALKVGVAYSYTALSDVEVIHNIPLGFGLSSHVGYRFTRWETNISSYLNFSKLKGMEVEANGSEINGDGNFQSVTFGPTVRYYYIDHPTKYGVPYVLGGAQMAMQTMSFGVNTYINGGSFDELHKLTFEGYGLLLGLGLDKNKKDKRNYFTEFVYITNMSRKTSEIGGTNTQVELITTEHSKRKVFEHTFFLSVGMTLF